MPTFRPPPPSSVSRLLWTTLDFFCQIVLLLLLGSLGAAAGRGGGGICTYILILCRRLLLCGTGIILSGRWDGGNLRCASTKTATGLCANVVFGGGGELGASFCIAFLLLLLRFKSRFRTPVLILFSSAPGEGKRFSSPPPPYSEMCAGRRGRKRRGRTGQEWGFPTRNCATNQH